MPRKPMEPGDLGAVTLTATATQVTARQRVCVDWGQYRDCRAVVAIDQTPSRSKLTPEERARQRALRDLDVKVAQALRGGTSALSEATPLTEAVDVWYEAFLNDPTKSSSSARTYEVMTRRHVKQLDAAGNPLPAKERLPHSLERLKLGVANDPQRLARFLQQVANRHGAGAAKTTRSVLNNTFNHAVRNGALERNRLRDLGTVHPQRDHVKTSPRDRKRAFTVAELRSVMDKADQLRQQPASDRMRAKREATYVLVCLMATTGTRISEATGITWADIDLKTGRTLIAGTKTATSRRTAWLPSWLLTVLKARKLALGASPTHYVASAPMDGEKRWDSSNVNAAMREVLDGAGFDWATPHVFRKTFATLQGDLGFSVRQIADALGHSDPSMTMRAYLSRDGEVGNPELAKTFEALGLGTDATKVGG